MTGFRIRYQGASFRLRSPETVIGRSRKCGIVVANRLTSREHAMLRIAGDELELVDLGSKNGVFVNGERVAGKKTLAHGDTFRIGTEVLEADCAGDATRNTLRDLNAQSYDPDEDVTATVDHGSTLDLAEVLLDNCKTPAQQPRTSQAIIAALDELLDHASFGQPALSEQDAQRVRKLVAEIAAWRHDGGLDPWREGVETRLATALRRASQHPPG